MARHFGIVETYVLNGNREKPLKRVNFAKENHKMLPFLKKSKEASVSVTPEVIVRESDHEDLNDDDMLHSVVSELVDAVHKKDASAVVDSLRAAFLILDSEPHVEGDHVDMEGMEE